jgi:hypothetical protein
MYPSTLPIYLAAFVPLFALGVAIWLDRKRRKVTEKPPQQEKLLRPPGFSLALRLHALQDKTLNSILAASAFCAIAGACALTLASFLGAHVPVLWTAFAIAGFAGFAFAGASWALRAFRGLNEARNVQLGLRGEQAVAESLHETADCGFRIFHDLPGGENWNIDHVAVGTRGVFLIETKARRRRPSRDGQPAHVVAYDGKVLQFPAGTDAKPVPQAERNARWLAEFLTKRTAEPVTVEPVLALPGWFVETKGNFPVKAMNATYLAKYLRGQSEKVEPAQVRRIIAVLDEKCRDVEF